MTQTDQPSRSRSAPQGVGDILRHTMADVSLLTSRVIELAKVELIPSAKTAGVGAGLLVGAAVFALFALGLIFIGCSVLIGEALGSVWLGFLIMAAGLLVITGVLAAIGVTQLNKSDFSATRTKQAATASITAVKGAVDRATTAAKTPALERHHD